MIDEATLAKAIERTKDVIDHCEGLRIEKAAGQNVVRTMFHRDSDIRILIAAARERDGLRAELAQSRRACADMVDARNALARRATHAEADCVELRTALESQRQATVEAVRRAEEARWELEEMRLERQLEQTCKVAR